MESALEPVASPGPTEVEAIIALTDPVLRNLRITECYHRLAIAARARVGGGADWCAFATWASRQAGRTIRGEDLLERLAAASRGSTLRHPIRSLWRSLLRRGLFQPETRLGRMVREVHTPFDAFERASEAVARGNLKVFAEIGLVFARWLDAGLAGEPPESDPSRRFRAELRSGEPPEGQSCLRRAFTLYQRASLETDPGKRERLRHLANLEIGFHEQTRLQPEIVAALEAGLDVAADLGARMLAALLPGAPRRVGPARRPLAWLLAWPGRRFLSFARRETRRAVTESLMQLAMPWGFALSLGSHLPDPPAASLRGDEPPELGTLRAAYEPCRRPDDCGADDWGDLHQRMHFILHLFAAYHERPELFGPPFRDEQVRAILAGVVPAGDI